MKSIPDTVLSDFISACHEVSQQGLVRCSSGNISVRAGDDLMVVSASRSWLERISPEQVTVCRISDGQVIEGPPPTVEIGFHAGILRLRPEINVVLHYQTPAATTLACISPENINFAVIPEIPFYMGPVGIIPYLMPGTTELASAVIETMTKHNIALMRNHGQITVAKDYDHAIQNGVFMELAANIILTAGDHRLQPLPEASAAELILAGNSTAGKV